MIFCLLDVHLPRVDCSLGKDTIEQVLRLPLERHQIPFLVSKAALKRCSIWVQEGFRGDVCEESCPSELLLLKTMWRYRLSGVANASAHQPEYEGVPINSSAFGIGRGFFHGHLVASDVRNPRDFPRSTKPSGLEDINSSAEFRVEVSPSSSRQGAPVREILKKERKRLPAFEGNWTEKFAFMHLSGFSSIWRLEDLPRVDYSSGMDTIEQVLKLPLERRQIPFLVSKAALKRCSIWEYKTALEVMSARKAAPKRIAPTEDDDEVQIIRSSKRQAVAAAAPSSSKKKSKVFPSTPVLLASEEDSSMAIQSLQGDLLHVASQLFHLGERMEGAASTKVEMDTLASQLREEKYASLAKDKEIKVLRLKVRNQEKARELAATENVSLRSHLKNRGEELNDLKDAAETFEAEKAMAVNGAKVVARWELMREWLSGQTDSWDPVNTLEQYKTVKITEVELLGLPAPSFEYEPQVPGDEEPGAILPWRGVYSRVNNGSGEKKLFLAPKWLGLRDFAGIDPNGGMWPREHGALVGTWANGHVALGARSSVVGRTHRYAVVSMISRKVICVGIHPLSLGFRMIPSCPSWLSYQRKISIYPKAGEITRPGSRRLEAGTETRGQEPKTWRQEPGTWRQEPGSRKLE
ncbi:hypothetical protein F2Q70_00017786 [Brassica cretica]|uniref:Uncharacterized protein n=2 Tax=Brassica cretica TaxID=69181 RepID=A0A8S9HZ82_BRACR|nr:hypothetical protein F2Q70_00017786 [Brassica cretica]